VAVRRDSPGPCGLAAEGESVMTMGDRIRPVKARTFDDGVRPVVTGLQKPLDVVPLRRRHQPGGNPRRS